jgi:RNA polymerase sigma-70 factor (ECF subfamily)
MGSFSEDSILQGLRSGGAHRPTYEKELYKSFFYYIKEAQVKYGLIEEDAASAYSDTIIIIIHNIVCGKFEGRSSLKTYSYKIFHNKCVDLLRKATTKRGKLDNTLPLDSLANELPDNAKTAIQKLIAKDERQLVMEKLNEIGDKCRELLLLFEDGYSDKEIAGLMNYQSTAVVKTTRLRCLIKLKLKLTWKLHQNG